MDTSPVFSLAREIIILSEREIVHFHAPSDCTRRFPRKRATFHATECRIKIPNLPATQQITIVTCKKKQQYYKKFQLSHLEDMYRIIKNKYAFIDRKEFVLHMKMTHAAYKLFHQFPIYLQNLHSAF